MQSSQEAAEHRPQSPVLGALKPALTSPVLEARGPTLHLLLLTWGRSLGGYGTFCLVAGD